MARNNRRWSPEVVEAMREDIRAGLTQQQVAKKYTTYQTNVSRLLRSGGSVSRPHHSKWAPEDLKDMREALDGGLSFGEIGAIYGISGERVRQLVGNANRHHPPGWKPAWTGNAEKNRREVIHLMDQGYSDKDISGEIGISVLYVQSLRSKSGRRRTLRHTPEHDIWCALKWFELFGYTPAVADWTLAMARASGQTERVERFEQFRREYGCPTGTSLWTRHGSWKQFIAKTGLPPALRGGAGHGRYKLPQAT